MNILSGISYIQRKDYDLEQIMKEVNKREMYRSGFNESNMNEQLWAAKFERSGSYSNKTIPTSVLWKEIDIMRKGVSDQRRYIFNQLHSYAIPDRDIISKISELVESNPRMNIVSLGAGLGLWERLIHESIKNKEDHPITALELDDVLLSRSPEHTYFPLTKGDYEMDILSEVCRDGNSLLFVCWATKYMFIRALTKCKPKYIVYIGERLDRADYPSDQDYDVIKIVETSWEEDPYGECYGYDREDLDEDWYEDGTIVKFYSRM